MQVDLKCNMRRGLDYNYTEQNMPIRRGILGLNATELLA